MQILFNAQGEWNKRRGEEQRMWKTEVGMLRMEGFEDVTEQRLLNDQTDHSERCIGLYSIAWNNFLGMHLPENDWDSPLANSIDTKLQDSTFVARGSIPIPLTTLPPLLHADKSHLRVKNTTFNPCKGVNESGNSIFNYPLVVSEEISSGIVSVTVTILPKLSALSHLVLPQSFELSLIVSRCGRMTVVCGFNKDQEGDCVRMEVGMDSKPRTLQFFVNGEAGQFYVSDLPTLVRIAGHQFVWIALLVNQRNTNQTWNKPNTRLVHYRSDETILAQAAQFMLSIDKYINAPEQYTESYEYAYLAGSVQTNPVRVSPHACAPLSSSLSGGRAEDAAEMVSFHNNETIADYAKEILILRPIGSKLIPLMKFRSEYWPNVSRRFKEFRSIKMNSDDDGCSSDAEYPIDVEKAAEKRARRTRYRKTSSSEHEYNEDDEYENDDEQYDEEEEAYEGEEEEESRSDASDEPP
ncbi:hypothetical protein BLNAU_24635 [Blattamonas nauphoetae]|uniref:Uncharacterized protein n=1 Tax=Blattamonas nauphoetae TaxID=2049346 RepID=A0ABQ9WLX1_9EUKA|nr:hypothetical protein BLNAU_24635 [Blattamonas nauphoetae]